MSAAAVRRRRVFLRGGWGSISTPPQAASVGTPKPDRMGDGSEVFVCQSRFLPPVLKSPWWGGGVSSRRLRRRFGREQPAPGNPRSRAGFARPGAEPEPNHLLGAGGAGRGRSARAPRPGSRPPARPPTALPEHGCRGEPRAPRSERGRSAGGLPLRQPSLGGFEKDCNGIPARLDTPLAHLSKLHGIPEPLPRALPPPPPPSQSEKETAPGRFRGVWGF